MTRAAAGRVDGGQRARLVAEADRLLGTPVPTVLARHVGAATLHADLVACLEGVAEAVRPSPVVIPPELTGVLSGGKRLRPLLVLAAARSAREPSSRVRERAVAGATAVELLHLASLVHDDIMDEAPLRHGAATINARAGAGSALLAGDLLLGRAHAAAADVGAEGARLIGDTLVRLCEGQAEENRTRYDPGRTEASYFRCVTGKTASLMAASCRLGALAAGRDAATAATLGRFGHHLGVAFQLADDLLDVTAAQAVAGKPVGHDLAGGVFTYPTLWAARRDPLLPPLLSAVGGPDHAAVVTEVARRVSAAGAPTATRQAIRRTRGRCLDALGAATDAVGPDVVDLLAEVASAMLPADDPAPARHAEPVLPARLRAGAVGATRVGG